MYHIFKALLAITFALFTFLSVHAQYTLYDSRYKTYSTTLESLAKSGDGMAKVSLGSCYDRGAGVQQNREKAFLLFEETAAQDNPLGLYNAAYYYEKGLYPEKNIRKAIEYYERSLSLNPNFEPALTGLARIYNSEEGFVDEDKVLEYNIRLADLNSTLGAYQAGRIFFKRKNLEKAKHYLMIAAQKGLKEPSNPGLFSIDNLASCYIAEKNYTEAAKWLTEAYKRGFIPSYHNLADLYYYGNGVGQDYKKAAEIFAKGAEKDRYCKYRLSVMYNNGLGVEKDPQKAFTLLEESAKAGLPMAQYFYAVKKYDGDGVQTDYNTAFEYFMKTVEAKNIPKDVKGDICRKISACYRFGRGVEANKEKAEEYNRLAASYGEPKAIKVEEWLNNSSD